MSAPNASDHERDGFRGQSGPAKHPGTIGQRVGRFNLASLDRQAKGSGTDAEPLRGFRQIHPAL
jgi:hypothetical protein